MPGTPIAEHAADAWILVGATATGKTAVAAEIARRTGALVLSADSMLVYRGMDVGTAKPTPEERAGTDLRGVDIVAPDEPFSAGRWLVTARAAFAEARAAGRRVIVAGGTGLYVNALLRGLDAPASDPAVRARLEAELSERGPGPLLARAEALSPGCTAGIDADNPRRVIRLLERVSAGDPRPSAPVAVAGGRIVGLRFDRARLAERIMERAKAMFANGLLDEAAALRAACPRFSKTAGAGIGYAEALAALDGRMSVEEAVEATALRTRRLAKKQETWYRHQLDVTWIAGPENAGDVRRAADEALEIFSGR